MKNKVQFLLLIVFFLPLDFLASQSDDPITIRARYGFPTPPETETSLFYLQRSQNANTIQYDIKLEKDGTINLDDPIDVYWLRYNGKGERRALKWIERNMAYGIRHKQLNKGVFEIEMIAYDDRPILVYQNSNGEIDTKMKINGKTVRFRSIFIDMVENGWFPTIKSIELFGQDLQTGEEVYERFNP